MSARVSSPIFIGRLAEMATLDDALIRATAGDPVVVLVGGEAGIGKSRLVAELAARVAATGPSATDDRATVLEGGCISLGSDEGLPFAPIAGALRGLVRRLDRASLAELIDPATRELGRLVPEFVAIGAEPSSADAPAEWAQTRLFDGFLTLLERLGERRPVVLILEDLHWADRSTRDLLAFLARALRDEHVLVIGTYRADELHRRHPLRPWLAEMGRLPRVEHVQLDRFGREEVADQLAAIQGSAASPALVDLIARRSEGNPFFAEELLAAGSATARPGLPDRLKDVLLGRMGSVSEPASQVLAAASVAGGSVDHELLAAVLPMDDATLTAAIEETISSQLIVPVADQGGASGDRIGDATAASYAFRHALLGEAVYDELLASERRRLHAAFAATLDARATPDGAAGASYLAALAYHATAASDLPLALRATIASARASTATSAFHEAAKAYERAISLWDAVSVADRPSDEDHVELLYEAAGALQTAQDHERSRDLAQAAVDAVDPAREPLRAARLEERLAWAVYISGDLAAGIRVLEESVDRIADQPPSVEAAALLAGLATLDMYAGRYRDCVPIAEDAIAMSRVVEAVDREVEAMGALGSALAIVGDCHRGLAVLREALATAHRLGDPIAIGMVYLSLTSTLFDCDALEESVVVGIEGSEWARGLRYPGFAGMAVEALVPLGRWGEAQAIIDDMPPGWLEGVGMLWIGTFAGVIAVRSGRLDDAQALLDIRRDGGSMLIDTALAGNLAGALLELALAEGRLSDARELADEGMAWLADADDVRFRSRVLRLAARAEAELAVLARARRDPETEADARAVGLARLESLRALMAPVAGQTSPVFGEARGNLALAEAEATRLVDRPDPDAWVAAARLFLSPRRPYELAWCRFRQAEAMLAVRAPRVEITLVLAEAWSVASEIGAVQLVGSIAGLARIARLDLAASATDDVVAPAAVASDGHSDPFGLTSREREVLTLLAAGETNRRIADTLFISESTASVHVSNILGKLGVSNRTEAAAAAVRLGLDH